MDKIINGKRYNTETADKLLYRGPYLAIYPYYELYQKQNGEYFLVNFRFESTIVTPMTEGGGHGLGGRQLLRDRVHPSIWKC